MRNQVLPLTCCLFFSSVALWGGQALRSAMKVPTAGVVGRITMDEFVGSQTQTNPLPKLKIYLFRVSDSRPLVALQEGCRRITAAPSADPMRVYRECDQNLRRAVDLVPNLPSVATTETDRDGQYEFPEVPAAGSYHIVAVKTVEGASPLVMVGIANRLKAGQRVTLDLSANDPWTRAKAP